VGKLNSVLTETARAFVGRKVVGGPGHQCHHWWTPAVQQQYIEFRRARRGFLKARKRQLPSLARVTVAYHLAKNRFRNTRVAAKKEALSRLATASADPVSKQARWSIWKKLYPTDVHPLGAIPNDDGSAPVSDLQSLNNLARHFMKRRPTPASPLDVPAREFWSTITHESLARVARLKPFSTAQVEEAFAKSRLNSSGSTPDGVHPLFIKHALPALVPVCVILFNFLLRACVFPDQWKEANGIALFKGGDRDRGDTQNYRGLSITSQLMRVYERCLRPLIVKRDPRPEQAGFRRGFSTSDNLYRVVERVYGAIRARSFLPVAFLDLTAAFDMVDPVLLLYKLRTILSFPLLLIVREYLTGRRWRLVNANLVSDWLAALSGPPQGGVLSPDFFSIYIDDLPLFMQAVETGLFADDVEGCPVDHGEAGVRMLRCALAGASRWALENHMIWSVAKSAVVIFTLRSRPLELSLTTFLLAKQPLPVAPSYKYLGIIFQSNGLWSEQARSLERRASATSAAICRLIAFDRPPGPLAVLGLVRALLVSMVLYGIALWRPNEETMANLQRSILRPLRLVLGLPRTTPTNDILAEFNLPPLERARDIELLNFDRRLLALPVGHLAADRLRQLRLPAEPARIPAVANPYAYFVNERRPSVRRKPRRLSLTARANALIRRWQLENPEQLLLQKFVRYRSVSSESLVVSRSDWALSVDMAVRLRYRPSLALLVARGEEPGLPVYFRSDEKPLACHRARLRMDQALLFGSLQRRRLESSSACPNCGFFDGSPVHLLVGCPTFAAERSVFVAQLVRFPMLRDYLRVPENLLSFVLGECSLRLSADVRRELLRITENYLLAIQAIRRF
jgi:hypothetical protein